MPKVTFYIDKANANSKGHAPIKANISFDNKNHTRTIDYCLPSDWNSNQQQVRPPRPGKKDNDHDFINKKLAKLQEEFKSVVKDYEARNLQLTADHIKLFLKGEKVTGSQKKPFWEAYDEYIINLKAEPVTKRGYTHYRDKLKEFEEVKGYLIDYHTINLLFFDKYQKYYLEDLDLSWNTLASGLKKLRFFMNWSFNRGYHQETDYKKITINEMLRTVIYLTEDELKRLYNYDFHSQRLNQARDKFMFGCLTGLAFADLDTLTHDHIHNGTLTKHREKTGKRVVVELADAALAIIDRYKHTWQALPKISNQKLNLYIKECCKIAGIDSPVVYKDFTGGRVTEKTAPKYELIGTHNARKTFITLFHDKTKDLVSTKQMAGITMDKTLRHYVGTDKEQARRNMAKAFENIKPPDHGPTREDFLI